MEYYRSPQSAPPGFLTRSIPLLVLRLSAGLSLLLWHGWRETFGAWLLLWRKTPWAFQETVAARGFPAPLPLSIALVIIGVLGSVFLILGLLTRVSSALLCVGAVTAAALYQADPDRAEKYLLYAAVYLVLVLSGPGQLSADTLLRRTVKRG